MKKLFLQHKNTLTSSLLWKQRLMFWSGAIMVGLVATGFALLCREADEIFRLNITERPYLPLIVTPLAFIVLAYGARYVFTGAQGAGIPQVIAIRHVQEPELRNKLVSLKIAMGKLCLVVIALMVGASTGREGPTVQIGAAIMLASGRLFGRSRQHGLVLAGGAAGIAAAFNTPLAGIVFAIEELSKTFERRTNSLVLTAIIFAGISSLAIMGNYIYLGKVHGDINLTDWPVVIFTSIIGGLLGGVFSQAIISVSRWAYLAGKGKPRVLGFAALCGLGVALIGYFSGGLTYGTGYLEARELITNAHSLPWYFGIGKMFATIFTSISGIAGGFFAPSLAVGAGFGANLANIFPHVAPAALVIVGMVAYFSGVVQAPITAFVIVFEMTGSHDLVVPIMAASLIGSGISRVICPQSIYHCLAENFLRALGKTGIVEETEGD